MTIESVFVWIGLMTALYATMKILRKFYYACRVYIFSTHPDFGKYGKWSVVTGSTNGIGKAVAFELASRGQNIVLISRNKERLQKVSQEIESKHGVETKYLVIDFCDDESIYDEIEEFLKDLDIGVLVNNVGMSCGVHKFLDIPNLSATLRDITRVNVFSLFKMHQIVLPGMVERKRGLIVNLSSGSCVKQFVYFQTYGATKAFINYFSQTLSYEYADKGITIQSCMPFLVESNMTADFPMHEMGLGMTSHDYANSLLNTVDKDRETHGCWQHALQGYLVKHTPTQFLHNIIPKLFIGKHHYDEEKQS